MKKLSTIILAAVSSLAVLCVATPTASASSRPALNLVALGDSFGSGTGAGDYQAGTAGNCWRSNNSYSEVTAAKLRADRQVTLANVTCSGAAIDDLRKAFKGQPAQLDALAADTDLVLLNIGGNDIALAAYAGQCISGDCSGAPAQEILGRIPAMSKNLLTLFGDIKARSPRAKVVLTGYGRQFSIGENAPGVQLDPICAPQVFSSQERTQGNGVARALDLALRNVTGEAKEKGFDAAFVSPYINSAQLDRAFVGHSLCEAETPYYRGFEALAPGQEGSEAVLHPNKDGQSALATLVLRHLLNLNSLPICHVIG